LPAHATHLLQPLNVGLFSPLQRYYSNSLDEYMRKGHSSINKEEFLPILMPARQLTFTVQNIRAAWEAVGIIPFNPRPVLGGVKREVKAVSQSECLAV
ncbi:hypothetical protein C7212DRAFT_233090, partial [Tuber magnatum]